MQLSNTKTKPRYYIIYTTSTPQIPAILKLYLIPRAMMLFHLTLFSNVEFIHKKGLTKKHQMATFGLVLMKAIVQTTKFTLTHCLLASLLKEHVIGYMANMIKLATL